MQKITTCLFFDRQGEEAAKFYTSIFKNSKIKQTSYYGEGAPMPKGTVMVVLFELNGHDFMALNGGPVFGFTPAISFMIDCKDQEEVDYYWEKLSDGGKTDQCGWLKDRYGVSWQITPTVLGEMLRDKDQDRLNRVMKAVWKMTKIEIAPLEEAYKQG